MVWNGKVVGLRLGGGGVGSEGLMMVENGRWLFSVGNLQILNFTRTFHR